mmetsp:Transcript_10785/g.34314  ORF Transcript_10785/g.34314 Transcript_10785/m.34314 type:complete len:230 (+) Transcript_10785:88-777(+)
MGPLSPRTPHDRDDAVRGDVAVVQWRIVVALAAPEEETNAALRSLVIRQLGQVLLLDADDCAVQSDLEGHVFRLPCHAQLNGDDLLAGRTTPRLACQLLLVLEQVGRVGEAVIRHAVLPASLVVALAQCARWSCDVGRLKQRVGLRNVASDDRLCHNSKCGPCLWVSFHRCIPELVPHARNVLHCQRPVGAPFGRPRERPRWSPVQLRDGSSCVRLLGTGDAAAHCWRR